MSLEIERLTVGPFQENCYVLKGDADAVVVDPGAEADRILDAVGDRTVRAIFLTHAHVDHVMALSEVRDATDAPVWLHPADRDLYDAAPEQARSIAGLEIPPLEPPDEAIEAGPWRAGPVDGRILATPGHTPGGVTLHLADEGAAMVGDVLFAGGIGRTDLGGDREVLLDSIESQLLGLPDDTRVLPGHGPETTIGRERRSNPFLR